MKSAAFVVRQKFGLAVGAGLAAVTSLIICGIDTAQAQNEPILVPEAVDYQKLLPILPESREGWTADKPEGSTEDVGGFRITNVHRDYHKGEGDKAPTAAKVTANQSPSMATPGLKHSKKTVNTPRSG